MAAGIAEPNGKPTKELNSRLSAVEKTLKELAALLKGSVAKKSSKVADLARYIGKVLRDGTGNGHIGKVKRALANLTPGEARELKRLLTKEVTPKAAKLSRVVVKRVLSGGCHAN
jgi:hypothetical protein